MTEAEWLNATDGKEMLRLVEHQTSGRKLRLLACCCVRHALPLMNGGDATGILSTAERLADGTSSDEEWEAAYHRVREYRNTIEGEDTVEWHLGALLEAPLLIDDDTAWGGLVMLEELEERMHGSRDASSHIAFLREIFGNPFRPVAFSSAWRTDTAVALARQMYEAREFGAMPILADALQDAGCNNDEVLSHCRGAGPHVRGCWVVDGVLGKE